jgi:hypothetical protein
MENFTSLKYSSKEVKILTASLSKTPAEEN